MTEAVNAITQYAFKQLGVKRIAVTCDVDNMRSKKVPERLWHKLESIVKSNRVNISGKISDTLVFARHNLPQVVVTWWFTRLFTLTLKVFGRTNNKYDSHKY